VEKDFHLEIRSRRSENRGNAGGFQSEEATGKCQHRMKLYVQDFRTFAVRRGDTCTRFTVETVMYIHGSQEENSRTPRKVCNFGSYNRSYFSRFVMQLYFSHWAIIPVMGALILA
jgi:hypothetical protein